MATLATGPITSSNTGFYAQQYSAKLYANGVIENPVNMLLEQNGCINREDDLAKSGGGTVNMYNALRLQSQGFTGDIDVYSNAVTLEKSTRSMLIAKNSMPITWPMRGTQTQQFASFDIGSANEEVLSDWAQSLITASMMNQLAGNTATSITQLTVDSAVFTGSNLTRITGNNSAIVPTYHYWASTYASNPVTTDASLTSSYPLVIKDFQQAAEIITAQISGKPTWQTIKGKPYIGIAFISMTGLYQLMNDPVTAAQGMQLSQLINAQLAGGKEMDLQKFMLPGIPFLFVVLPDNWLPYGVNLSTGAEVANTRRAVIVGSKALDVSYGAGFTPAGGKTIPGMGIEFDTKFKTLNKQGFGVATALWGCKKAQATGTGDGNSTAYDLSTYVIAHYSRNA